MSKAAQLAALIGDYPIGTNNVALGDNALDSVQAGGNYNTAIGSQALTANTTGDGLTAVGYQSLNTASTTSNLTAVGYRALATATGIDNVAVGAYSQEDTAAGVGNTSLGYISLYQNISGDRNTGVGRSALQNNTTADNNTAVGYQASYTQTTGSANVSVGADSHYAVTTGNQSVAVGYQAQKTMTTGSENTALGQYSNYYLTTGIGNSSIGQSAGYNITTANNNVCVGKQAGYYSNSITSGSGNVYVGAYTQPAAGGGAHAYAIVVGYNGTAKGSNTGLMKASSGMYQSNNSSAWSTTSDERLKKNIVNNDVGLSVINTIQVRNFNYRTEDEITDDIPVTDAVDKSEIQIGVIAQELEAVFPSAVQTLDTGTKTVITDELFWHMLNSIKELSTKNNELTTRIEALEV